MDETDAAPYSINGFVAGPSDVIIGTLPERTVPVDCSIKIVR